MLEIYLTAFIGLFVCFLVFGSVIAVSALAWLLRGDDRD